MAWKEAVTSIHIQLPIMIRDLHQAWADVLAEIREGDYPNQHSEEDTNFGKAINALLDAQDALAKIRRRSEGYRY